MKHRMINTSFHLDDKIEILPMHAKWLFMYFLTCSYIGMTGAFSVSDRRIMFETSLTEDELIKAKDELQKAGFVDFRGSFIIVKNANKHNSYRVSAKTSKAYEAELKGLPKEIQSLIEGVSSLTDRVSVKDNVSPILITEKEEVEVTAEVKETVEKKSRDFETEDDIRSPQAIAHFSALHQIAQEDICEHIELFTNHAYSKGWSCKNWGAEFDNWLRRGLRDDKIRRVFTSTHLQALLPEITLHTISLAGQLKAKAKQLGGINA